MSERVTGLRRITHYALRITHYVLRITHYALVLAEHSTHYVDYFIWFQARAAAVGVARGAADAAAAAPAGFDVGKAR